MTKSLAQLNAQIAKLQREADTLKAKEARGVIARVKEAIAHYGLTAADVGFSGAGTSQRQLNSKPAGKKARQARQPSKGRGVVKYADDSGNTWTGHGRRPRWYTDALEAGATEESLLAKPGR